MFKCEAIRKRPAARVMDHRPSRRLGPRAEIVPAASPPDDYGFEIVACDRDRCSGILVTSRPLDFLFDAVALQEHPPAVGGYCVKSQGEMVMPGRSTWRRPVVLYRSFDQECLHFLLRPANQGERVSRANLSTACRSRNSTSPAGMPSASAMTCAESRSRCRSTIKARSMGVNRASLC